MIHETLEQFKAANDAGAPPPDKSEIIKKVGKAIGEASQSGKQEDVDQAIHFTLGRIAEDALKKAQATNPHPPKE